MNKIGKIVIYLGITVLFLVPLVSIESTVWGIETNINDVNTDSLDGGWIEEHCGIKILQVSGTNYEMGYQQGYYLKKETIEIYRAVLELASPSDVDNLLELWDSVIKDYIPSEYLEELQGFVDGSELPAEVIIVSNFADYFLVPTHCMEIAAWGPATAGGRLIHARSVEWVAVKDPTSGKYLHDNQILCVRKPANGSASLHIPFAHTFLSSGGFNINGIAVSDDASLTMDYTWHGAPWGTRILQILDYATTAGEAIDFITENKTGGYNNIISDAKIPTAFVSEKTANNSYIGTWDDDTESISPFWSINHVVRRKNMFIHPDLSATQRPFHDPRVYYINSLYTGVDYFHTWRYYKTLSEEIEALWGTIDMNNTFSMMSSVYRGETDIIIKLYKSLEWTEPIRVFHLWAVCPETGDMVVSFADGEQEAQFTPIHHFNLYELLEENGAQ